MLSRQWGVTIVLVDLVNAFFVQEGASKTSIRRSV